MTVRERTLFMGGPGTGKTTTLLKIGEYFATELKRPVFAIDLEDKLEATCEGEYGKVPDWLNMNIATEGQKQQWEQLRAISQLIIEKTKPGDCILFDRVDLSWVAVRRWYSQEKFDKDLAERMLDSSKAMGKKSAMFTPEFDQGGWEVVGENYSSVVLKLVYGFGCNVFMTSGIQDAITPGMDVFAIGVKPRGQPDLAHQPHSVFLLHQNREKQKDGKYKTEWLVTTAKDIKGRPTFENEPVNFVTQYLDLVGVK